MAERRYVHALAPIARKHVARTERELLPAKLRELVERLREAEPISDPREREGTQRRAQGNKCACAHHLPPTARA